VFCIDGETPEPIPAPMAEAAGILICRIDGVLPSVVRYSPC
jgi:hypothetical protein